MSLTSDAQAMANKLRSIGRQLSTRTADAMKSEAEDDMAVMKSRAPYKTGKLRDSGEVHDPVIDADGTISVTSSFGGPDVPYAVEQHEHIEFHHDVGEAKWMERTMNESRQTMLGRVGRKIAFKNW